jgi:hypothetical protein
MSRRIVRIASCAFYSPVSFCTVSLALRIPNQGHPYCSGIGLRSPHIQVRNRPLRQSAETSHLLPGVSLSTRDILHRLPMRRFLAQP